MATIKKKNSKLFEAMQDAINPAQAEKTKDISGEKQKSSTGAEPVNNVDKTAFAENPETKEKEVIADETEATPPEDNTSVDKAPFVEKEQVINVCETQEDVSMKASEEVQGNTELMESARVNYKKQEGLCTSSVTIQRSSANFLAYKAKRDGDNRDTCLAKMLLVEMKNDVVNLPDFDAVVERRSISGCVSKTIRLPETIMNWAKEHAALEMKSLSAYIDEVLQAGMKEMQQELGK